jgi:uncharacterized membrane-anchored protein YhcB (DUF1043 family)
MACNLLAASSQLDSQGVWLAIAAVAVIVIYVLMRPRNKKEPLTPPRFPLARQREVEEQMNTLLVELSQMARQITSQLDTRAMKLETLIKDADERLAALQAAKNSVAPDSGVKSDDHASGDEVAELHAPPQQAASPMIAVEARHQEVYTMADEGRSPSEIAKIVQRPAGEVELILALRPK